MPVYAACVAGVVESVLRAGRAVTIDPDVHSGVAGPGNGFVEVCVCSCDVWGAGVVVGPVSDRDAEGVDACCGEGLDVGFGEIGAPMCF